MVELILIYCLAAHMDVCREERPLPMAGLSAASCMFAAQPIAAGYVAAHPQWALHGWRCEIWEKRR